MNPIQRTAQRLLGLKSLGDPVAGASVVVPPWQDNRPVQRAWTQDDILRVAASACEVAANCMVFRADAVARAPFGAMINDEFHPEHQLSQLFFKVNDFFSQSDFWHQVIYTLDANAGGVYILAPLDARGLPAELWVRSSNNIRPVASTESFISGYEMRVGNVWKPVDPNQYLIWQHRFVPMDVDDLYGSWPPLLRAQHAVRSFQTLGTFIETVLANKAMLDGFITNRGNETPDKDTSAIIDSRVQEQYNGPTVAGGIRYLPGNMMFVKMGATLADVDPGAVEDRLAAKISGSFQLNPVSVRTNAGMSATSGLGGDKIEQLIHQDYSSTIASLWSALAADVGIAVAERYGLTPDQVGFDVSDISELEESPTARMERAKSGTGFLTINDQRAIVGSLDLVDGDVVIELEKLRMLGDRLAASLVKPEPNATDTASGAVETPKTGPRPPEKKERDWHLLGKAVDVAATAHESSFLTAARRVFADERKAVLDHLPGYKAKSKRLQTKDVAYFDDYLDEAAWVTSFKGLVSEAMTSGADLQELGITFDMTHPLAVQAVMRRVNKLAGEVTDTTRSAIQQAVQDNIDSHATMSDLADAIGGVFDAADGARSALIARTESIGALNEGSYVSGLEAQAMGLDIVKTWISFMDERTRDSHLIDGEETAMDELFSNGLLYPHDPAAGPEEVCNCRCSLGTYNSGDTSVTAVDESANTDTIA